MKERDKNNASDGEAPLPQILKPFVFCLEILRDGVSQDDVFSYTIHRMGGKVLKAMGKSATHFIWSNGKLKNLLKASDLGLQIVSPLWLKACTEQSKAVQEDDYRPSNLKEKLEAARN
jgi:twin BRCT domain